MATKRQGFENGADGAPVTDANKATILTDGDVFGTITISGTGAALEIDTGVTFYGTRSLRCFGGGTTGQAYCRWTGGTTVNKTGFVVFAYAILPSLNGLNFLQVLTAGGATLATLGLNSSNQIQTKDQAATLLNTAGYSLVATTKYRLDYQFVAGTTASNGTIKWWLYPFASTDRMGAGTPLASYTNTACNVGTAQTLGQTKLPGKLENASTLELNIDEPNESDTLTMPLLPGSNNPPVANAGLDVYATAGDVQFTGYGTDSDGTVKTLPWSYISGPGPSSISQSTSNINTASASNTGTIAAALPGVHVVELNITDNLDLAGAADRATIYISPPVDTPIDVVSATKGAGASIFGAAASDLIAVTGADDTNGIRSADNPTLNTVVLTGVCTPHRVGPLTAQVRMQQGVPGAGSIDVKVRWFAADGVTPIGSDSDPQTVGTSWVDYTFVAPNDVLLAIPSTTDRGALTFKVLIAS